MATPRGALTIFVPVLTFMLLGHTTVKGAYSVSRSTLVAEGDEFKLLDFSN